MSDWMGFKIQVLDKQTIAVTTTPHVCSIFFWNTHLGHGSEGTQIQKARLPVNLDRFPKG